MLTEFPSFLPGDNITINLNVKDSNGQPQDCQNALLWLTIKAKPELLDSEATLQLQINLPQYSDILRLGQVTFNIAGSATQNIMPSVYWWDLKIALYDPTTSKHSSVQTIGYGTLLAKRSVNSKVPAYT